MKMGKPKMMKKSVGVPTSKKPPQKLAKGGMPKSKKYM